MTSAFFDRVFTPSVKAAQQAKGSRDAYARFQGMAGALDELTAREAQFISARDSFYMATVGAGGWPYLQHRGGPPGFVKVLNARSLALAEFRGNRQYVSLGNLTDDARVALFFMDYPNRARLKLLGRARVIDFTEESDLAAALVDQTYMARVERGLAITVEAFDWNCPQHITPRFSLAELAPTIDSFKTKIAELEAEIARLNSRTASSPP
jgi:uncharacterized protein